MPTSHRVLTVVDATRYVGESGFEPPPDGPGPGRHLGIELEWLAVRLTDPTRPADLERVQRAIASVQPLPAGSRVTFEPGGQVELSSPPFPGLGACAALPVDAHLVGRALAGAGVGLFGLGLEPGPQRARLVRSPRYDAMEAYFDVTGPAGRTMMRSTAAVQVNLDLGEPVEIEGRWRRAHELGPMLAAAFANSPFARHGPSGWRSTRLAVWLQIDRNRTAPVSSARGAREAWAQYALDAGVMLVRLDDHRAVPVLDGLTFGRWIASGHELGWPTLDDLGYHLTTLFPPVRPRGWLELRMIDALPEPWWQVAAAVTAVLVNDPEASDAAGRIAAPTGALWVEAARSGLSHPALGHAARECFILALDALERAGADAGTAAAAAAYFDHYVARGRCPADDLLDLWTTAGNMLPTADNLRDRPWT